MAAPVVRSVTAEPTVLLPGQSTTVRVDAYHPDSRLLTLSGRVSDPTGAAWDSPVRVDLSVPLLVGMSAEKGARTQRAVAEYPGIRYMRDFGTDGGDADALPELPPLNAGKFVDAPSAVMHVSWKDDVEQLTGWLDGLSRPIYLTWYHEPMGDVTPATYRTTATRVAQIVAAHRVPGDPAAGARVRAEPHHG